LIPSAAKQPQQCVKQCVLTILTAKCVWCGAVCLQAQLKEWETAEAQKKALAREIALKLKADRAAQLADRDLVSRCWMSCLQSNNVTPATRKATEDFMPANGQQ
jgi:hypothetical protein